jgi:hypothetical protein
MNHKIRKLLDKKNITGEELGKAYITTRVQEKIKGEVILTDEEFKILLAKIIESSEMNQANAYVNFYTWLEHTYLATKSHYNNFYVGFSILYLKLSCTIESEQGFNKLKFMDSIYDTKGDYQRLKDFTENILTTISVFSQVTDKEGLDFMQDARYVVRAGLPCILSYNRAVGLFADFLKIPEILRVFKIGTEGLFNGISMLNEKIVLLRKFLYGTKEETIKKLKVLDDIYPVINIPDFEPTEAAIKKATKSLKSSILSFNPHKIIKILDSTLSK